MPSDALLEEQVASFWRFVLERDRVFVRRQAGEPAPWTADEIIAGHHFTNVHRDRDPGTRWIVDQHARWGCVLDDEELLFRLVAYRTLNRVATFERFGFPARDRASVDEWAWALRRARRNEDFKVGSQRHQTSLDRTERSLLWMADHDSFEWVVGASDGVDAVGALDGIPGLGPFYAIQVVGDLVTVGVFPIEDPMTSLAVGSRSAIMLLTGRHHPDMLMPEDQSTWRRGLAKQWQLNDQERAALTSIHDEQPDGLSKPMTYADIEHSLCEWNRYHKLQIGDPRIGRRIGR